MDEPELPDNRLQLLAAWSELAGLNNTGLAKRLQVSPSTLRNWLRGDSLPQADNLSKLLLWLFDLSDAATGRPARPDAAEVWDWLVLLGLSGDKILAAARVNPAVLKWLETAMAARFAWPRPLLPQAWISRELDQQVVSTLTDLTGYRQPRYRVVVLKGGAGNGKTTLVRAIMQPGAALESYFRHGAVWLDQAEAASERFSWPDWFSQPATVALVVLDDCHEGAGLDRLLAQAGPQVRVLITTQQPDTLSLTLDKHLRPDQVCELAVGKLSEAEGLALIERLTNRPIAQTDLVDVRKVLQAAGYPLLVRVLAHEAEKNDWATVWRWVQQEPAAGSPLPGYASEFLAQAWQRLPQPEQTALARLVEAVPPGHSFGETLAAVIWGQPETVTRNQLKALAEQGWLEVMDEIEWGTPSVVAAALGQPRYRLPTACSVLIRPARVSYRVQLWVLKLTWRLPQLFRVDPVISLAAWLNIPLSIIALVLLPWRWLKPPPSRSKDHKFGGNLTKQLHQRWRNWPGFLPSEIKLLQQGRQDRTVYIVVLLGLVILLLNLWDIGSLLTPVISLVVCGLVIWAAKWTQAWELLLLLAYSPDEPVEVRLARRLVQWYRRLRGRSTIEAASFEPPPPPAATRAATPEETADPPASPTQPGD